MGPQLVGKPHTEAMWLAVAGRPRQVGLRSPQRSGVLHMRRGRPARGVRPLQDEAGPCRSMGLRDCSVHFGAGPPEMETQNVSLPRMPGISAI